MSRRELSIWIFGALVLVSMHWAFTFPLRQKAVERNSLLAAADMIQSDSGSAVANAYCKSLIGKVRDITNVQCSDKNSSGQLTRGDCTMKGLCKVTEFKDQDETWKPIPNESAQTPTAQNVAGAAPAPSPATPANTNPAPLPNSSFLSCGLGDGDCVGVPQEQPATAVDKTADIPAKTNEDSASAGRADATTPAPLSTDAVKNSVGLTPATDAVKAGSVLPPAGGEQSIRTPQSTFAEPSLSDAPLPPQANPEDAPQLDDATKQNIYAKVLDRAQADADAARAALGNPDATNPLDSDAYSARASALSDAEAKLKNIQDNGLNSPYVQEQATKVLQGQGTGSTLFGGLSSGLHSVSEWFVPKEQVAVEPQTQEQYAQSVAQLGPEGSMALGSDTQAKYADGWQGAVQRIGEFTGVGAAIGWATDRLGNVMDGTQAGLEWSGATNASPDKTVECIGGCAGGYAERVFNGAMSAGELVIAAPLFGVGEKVAAEAADVATAFRPAPALEAPTLDFVYDARTGTYGLPPENSVLPRVESPSLVPAPGEISGALQIETRVNAPAIADSSAVTELSPSAPAISEVPAVVPSSESLGRAVAQYSEVYSRDIGGNAAGYDRLLETGAFPNGTKLQISPEGNVELIRFASSEEHLVKFGNPASPEEMVDSSGWTYPSPGAVHTSADVAGWANPDTGTVFGYNTYGIFKIPAEDFAALANDGKLIIGNLKESEIVLSGDIAKQYLAEVHVPNELTPFSPAPREMVLDVSQSHSTLSEAPPSVAPGSGPTEALLIEKSTPSTASITGDQTPSLKIASADEIGQNIPSSQQLGSRPSVLEYADSSGQPTSQSGLYSYSGAGSLHRDLSNTVPARSLVVEDQAGGSLNVTYDSFPLGDARQIIKTPNQYEMLVNEYIPGQISAIPTYVSAERQSLDILGHQPDTVVLIPTTDGGVRELSNQAYANLRALGDEVYGVPELRAQTQAETAGRLTFSDSASFPSQKDFPLDSLEPGDKLTPLSPEKRAAFVDEVSKAAAEIPTSVWDKLPEVPVTVLEYGPRLGSLGDVKSGGFANYENRTMWINPNDSISRVFYHEMGHFFDNADILPSNTEWIANTYGKEWSTPYRGASGAEAIGSGNLQLYGVDERPEGFACTYGYCGGIQEDKATMVEYMFGNYPSVMEAAQSDPVLAAKVQMVKDSFYNATNGEMNDTWWAGLTPSQPWLTVPPADSIALELWSQSLASQVPNADFSASLAKVGALALYGSATAFVTIQAVGQYVMPYIPWLSSSAVTP